MSLSQSSKKLSSFCSSLIDLCECSVMEHKHAACIIKGGKILESGFNYNTRSKVGNLILPSIHAEMSAILKYCKRTRVKVAVHCRQKWSYQSAKRPKEGQCILS